MVHVDNTLAGVPGQVGNVVDRKLGLWKVIEHLSKDAEDGKNARAKYIRREAAQAIKNLENSTPVKPDSFILISVV